MTPKHVAATTAALNAAATVAGGPIMAGAGSGMSMPRAEFDAARAAARKAGAEAERTRISAILKHEAAAGRGKLANKLAFGTDMGVDAAVDLLGASASESAAPGMASAGTETVDWSEIVAGFNSTLPGAQTQGSTR